MTEFTLMRILTQAVLVAMFVPLWYMAIKACFNGTERSFGIIMTSTLLIVSIVLTYTIWVQKI